VTMRQKPVGNTQPDATRAAGDHGNGRSCAGV
jgi:hypothetical protein